MVPARADPLRLNVVPLSRVGCSALVRVSLAGPYVHVSIRCSWPRDETAPMPIILILLVLAFEPSPARCKPQFAPLDTGTSSGPSALDFWRRKDAGAWGGGGWLGWTWTSAMVQPVRLVVRNRPKDSPQQQEEEVTVESKPAVTFAVRCVSGVRAGKIHDAGIANHDLHYDGPLNISIGKLRYEFTPSGEGTVSRRRQRDHDGRPADPGALFR